MKDIDISLIDKKMDINKYFDKTFYIGFIAILIYYFLFDIYNTVLLQLIYPLFNQNSNSFSSLINASYNMIIYIAIAIPLFFIYKDSLIKDYKRIDDTNKFCLYIIFSLIALFIVNILSSMLQNLIVSGVSKNEETIQTIYKNKLSFCILFPQVVILAPFVEELIFRRSFFNIFKNKYIALIITTLIFGFMHVTSTYQSLIKTYDFNTSIYYTFGYAIPYLANGLLFGLIYIKSDKNIYVSMMVHLINNFSASILSILIISLI